MARIFPLQWPDELKSLFDNLGADMQVLILDACESGDFLRAKGGVIKSRVEVKATDELDSKGTIILSSSAVGGYSEVVNTEIRIVMIDAAAPIPNAQ